jgi:hypothetical protein
MSLTDIWSTIKQYTVIIGVAATAIFAALFMWERNEVAVDEALVDEQKVNNDLNKDNQVIQTNDQQLSQLEEQRKALENAQAPQASITDITKWFNRKQ